MSAGDFHVYDGVNGVWVRQRDGLCADTPASPYAVPRTNTTKKTPVSMVGPNGEKVASIGPWVAATGEPYKLASRWPLDPNSAAKVSVLVDGIRRGTYGNALNFNIYEYGFSIWEVTQSTPRYRMNKIRSDGVNESNLSGYGFYDPLQFSGTSFEKRPLLVNAAIEPTWSPSSGTDGALITWDPVNDEENDYWQFTWKGRTDGQLDGVPTVAQSGRLTRLSQNEDTAFPQFNSQWFHGVSASRLAAGPYVVKIAELDRAIDANGYLRDTITVTRPDGSQETIDALDSIEHVLVSGAHGDWIAKAPAVSYPVRSSDNWGSSRTGDDAIRYGQITRMPADINWRTWKPDGWTGDERPLGLMRLVGRAWQKHGCMVIDWAGAFGIGAQTNDAERREALVARIPNKQLLPGGWITGMTLLPVERLEACAVRTGPDGAT